MPTYGSGRLRRISAWMSSSSSETVSLRKRDASRSMIDMLQPTLSRNSLNARSKRWSRRTSTTVTCGLATNQPAAVI